MKQPFRIVGVYSWSFGKDERTTIGDKWKIQLQTPRALVGPSVKYDDATGKFTGSPYKGWDFHLSFPTVLRCWNDTESVAIGGILLGFGFALIRFKPQKR